MGGGRCSALLALCCSFAALGCGFSASYDGTHYRCGQEGECPAGFTCAEGLCVVGARGDAAIAEDGAETMMSSSSDPETEIPDAAVDGISDTVEFAAPCTINDITVDVDITHSWRGDLAISLTSPSHTEVDLHDYVDEEDVEDLVGTYPTTLTPVESLDAFIGEEGVGVWTLWVADVDNQDLGTLHSWAVHLWCE